MASSFTVTEAVVPAAPAEISTLPVCAFTRPFVASPVPSETVMSSFAVSETSAEATTSPSTSIFAFCASATTLPPSATTFAFLSTLTLSFATMPTDCDAFTCASSFTTTSPAPVDWSFAAQTVTSPADVAVPARASVLSWIVTLPFCASSLRLPSVRIWLWSAPPASPSVMLPFFAVTVAPATAFTIESAVAALTVTSFAAVAVSVP